MGEIHCKWRKEKETRVAGSYVELILQKIEENASFSCPKHCQKICKHKTSFSENPRPNGFTFTALMMQLRNISPGAVFFPDFPPWVTIVDNNNRHYFEQEVCPICTDFIHRKYGDIITTKNARCLGEGVKAEFFLFFPQFLIGARPVKLVVESFVRNSSFGDPNTKGDVFHVWISSDEEKHLTLEDFSTETILMNAERHSSVAGSSPNFSSETRVQSNKKAASPSYSDYRFRPDFSTLPPVRITPITSIHQQEHDVMKTIKIIEESAEEREPLVIVQPPRPRRYYPWSIEDRRIFSYEESTSEYLGYCEGCENFGWLSYSEGLFLCPTCGDLLHEQ